MNWGQAFLLLYDVPRLMDMAQGELLFQTSLSLPDGAKILEIGAWKGFSTCCLALGQIGKGGLVHTIDTFHGNPINTNDQDGPDSYDEFWSWVVHCGVEQYVNAMRGQSEDFYKTWKEPVDLLFIDGLHPIMRQDYEAFYPHVKTGGWLFMHDIYGYNPNEPFTEGMQFIHNMGFKIKP